MMEAVHEGLKLQGSRFHTCWNNINNTYSNNSCRCKEKQAMEHSQIFFNLLCLVRFPSVVFRIQHFIKRTMALVLHQFLDRQQHVFAVLYHGQ
jgi:hypothetical protein